MGLGLNLWLSRDETMFFYPVKCQWPGVIFTTNLLLPLFYELVSFLYNYFCVEHSVEVVIYNQLFEMPCVDHSVNI